MAGVHIILAVVYETPLDVLMYNEKKRYDVRKYLWFKIIFSLPIDKNHCSYACIVTQATHIWDVMTCKGINTSTINISSIYQQPLVLVRWYSWWIYHAWYNTDIQLNLSQNKLCRPLLLWLCTVLIRLSYFTLPIFLTIWHWNSRPVVIIRETESRLLTLYPHTRNQAVLSAGSANRTRKDPSTIFKKNSTIITSTNSNSRFQIVFFNGFLGEKFANLRSTPMFLSLYSKGLTYFQFKMFSQEAKLWRQFLFLLLQWQHLMSYLLVVFMHVK